MEKNFEAALKKEKANSKQAVAIEEEREAVTTKHKKLLSSVEQRLGSVNIYIACLEEEAVKVTQKQDASVTKAENLLLEF